MSTEWPEPEKALDDIAAGLREDIQVLHRAAAILREQFVANASKYAQAVAELRSAEAELLSRARHPSRQRLPS
jgi:hypothetical protein